MLSSFGSGSALAFVFGNSPIGVSATGTSLYSSAIGSIGCFGSCFSITSSFCSSTISTSSFTFSTFSLVGSVFSNLGTSTKCSSNFVKKSRSTSSGFPTNLIGFIVFKRFFLDIVFGATNKVISPCSFCSN